jgi:hypothetical protein
VRRLVIACVIAAEGVAGAASYWVTPTGNDTSGDGSSGKPWLTLQHAADQVVAGDTVNVAAGTYRGFSLGWNNPQNGTAGNPISFLAQPGVIIDMANANTADGIDLEGCSWIVVDGFEVSGVARAGIRSVSNGTTNATNVTLRNNWCHDNAMWGLFTSHVDNLLIENNRAARSAQQHGIYVSNACVNPVVRGNTLFGNNDAGLHMNGDASQGGTGIITGATVENNIIYDNGVAGASGINCDGVQSSRIQNNLIYNEHASGISLYQTDAAMPAINNIVVNNTIVVAGDGRWALNIKNGSTGNHAYNNILLDENAGQGSIDIAADSLSGFVSDYNVVVNQFTPDDGTTFVSLATWRTMTGQDAHSLIASEAMLFVGGGDYHLSASSAAIDRGTTTQAPAADLDGTSRPQGAAIDIGAYERIPGAGIDLATSLDLSTTSGADLSMVSSADLSAISNADLSAMSNADLGGVPTPPSSGCGCVVAGVAPSPPWLLLLVPLLLSRRIRIRSGRR